MPSISLQGKEHRPPFVGTGRRKSQKKGGGAPESDDLRARPEVEKKGGERNRLSVAEMATGGDLKGIGKKRGRSYI